MKSVNATEKRKEKVYFGWHLNLSNSWEDLTNRQEGVHRVLRLHNEMDPSGLLVTPSHIEL